MLFFADNRIRRNMEAQLKPILFGKMNVLASITAVVYVVLIVARVLNLVAVVDAE